MTNIEAKCPNCNNKALVNEDMTEVNCKACSFTSSYEDYLETMKTKAVQMASDLQLNWDKN
jgi:DNA-directed RNA polymerase subunit RPC12/RpoP